MLCFGTTFAIYAYSPTGEWSSNRYNMAGRSITADDENEEYTEYIQTPMGSNVLVKVQIENSDWYIEDTNQEIADAYPDAEFISSASNKYNCHSYAWYSSTYNNPYWMNDPSEYINDGSYVLSTGQVGDIIAYYGSNGSIIHSGIVLSIYVETLTGGYNDLQNITVESKWSQCGLYRHRGD